MSWFAPEFSNTPVAPARPHFGYEAHDPTASPAVTIVTPYFNTGAIFLETAQSVLSQSLQQWEWLIVNDASSDPDALRILDAFRERDSRIAVIDLEHNRGLPGARNVGLRKAQAPLVFFLDSDDLIEPTTLEKTAWCLDSYSEFSFCKGWTVEFGAVTRHSTSGFEPGRLFLSRNVVTIRCMVRRDVALAVGGFDESLTTGLEDWEFWLRCAARGHWGRSIPEYLDWYRRRDSHSDRWAAWTTGGIEAMRRELRRRYPELYAGKFPQPVAQRPQVWAEVRDEIPFSNLLAKHKRRVLLIVPWMALGGADKFNLDVMRQLMGRGYEISIATTLEGNYPWYEEFAKLTPDIFILPHFLRPSDYPRFLQYLIQSRQTDYVFLSHSELGYRFLPYLRARCPSPVFVDYPHLEEEDWSLGGYAGISVGYQEMLDLTMVTSNHLKEWMVGRGAGEDKIEVCYSNVDTKLFSPSPQVRSQVRAELSIPPDLPVILYASRLCEQKQPRVFAEVMKELRARGLQFVCLVAGDGEDRKWLSRYLRRQRLSKQVRMLGAVTRERVQQLLAASDLFFLPSKKEGIAGGIYEAMSMEVACVGADVGGQSELLTPECGVLVPRGTPQEEVARYSDVLQDLIRSPARREAMGKAARDRVCSHFRIEQMGDRMESLLERAVSLQASRPEVATGPGLGAEHARQAIELDRVVRAAQPLWKYQTIDAAGSRSAGMLWNAGFWLEDHLGPLHAVVPYLREVKDRLWIRGHKLKVRLGLKEPD